MFFIRLITPLIALILTATASAQSLKSPYNVELQRATWSNLANTAAFYGCPNYMPPVINLHAESVYTNGVVDPRKVYEYQKATKNALRFATNISRLSDQFVTTKEPDPSIAQCTLGHLNSWASQNALMGELDGSAAYGVLTNVLAPASQAFLKIRDVDNLNTQSVTNVKHWLNHLATQLVNYHANTAGPFTQHNNHRYWDGYAVLGAAIASNDESLFLWANQSLDIGLRQIQADGTLPLEMLRRDKAYHYHVYALSSLVALSEGIHINKSKFKLQSPYTRYSFALQRLVNLVINQELQTDIAIFLNQAPLECHQFAWSEIFMRRHTRTRLFKNAPELAALIENKRNDGNCGGRLYATNLGGATTYSFGLVNLNSIINDSN